MKVLSYKQSRAKFLFENRTAWVNEKLDAANDSKWLRLYKEWCKDNSYPSKLTLEQEYEDLFKSK